MMEDFNEKLIQRIKICTIIVIGVIVGICVLFFISVTKVDALTEFGAFNGSSNVAWWVGTENFYQCKSNCPSFNRIVVPFYGSKTSTDNSMVFGFNIYIQAKYQNLYPVTQTVNITPYALWSTDNDLWNNWSLLDSCSITGTTSQSGDAVITKEWTYQVNCNGKPPSANHFPTIYFSFTKQQGNGLVILNEFMTGYTSMTMNIVQGTETSAIIDNNNQVGQNIIDNQTQNKDEIIANQNENTDKITDAIENQNNACENFTYDKNSDIYENNNQYLNPSGVVSSNNNWKLSKYLPVSKGKSINFTPPFNGAGAYMCLYDKNKNLLECIQENTSRTITPTQDGYLRFSSTKQQQYNNTISGEYCYNRIDQTNDNLNDINDSLNDSSVDNPNSSFNGLQNNFSENSVISDLLLLPVTLYQSVLNSINGTCTAFNLGTLYGHNLSMPCLNISGVIGNAIYGIIDVLISGFFILGIRKKFVDIFQHFTSLKVGGNELE